MSSAPRFLALPGGLVHPAAIPGAPTAPGTLLIRDRVIHGVYHSLPAAETAARAAGGAGAAVEVVDISGNTVLPGLIDCHVHLFFDGGPEMTTGQTRDLQVAAGHAAAHLRAGVTTVRDLGAPVPDVFQLRDQLATGQLADGQLADGLADGQLAGPRVIAAGPIITVPNGHGGFVGEVVPDGAGLPAAVARLAELGADGIKIAVSGGVSTPGSDLFAVQFTEPQLRAGVAAAHRLGLPVAAHASNPESIRIAAAAGVDSIEHAVLVDDPALAALAASGATLVPTLAATNRPPDFLADPRIPEYIREKARITVPAHRASIARAVAAGIPIAGGTDAGSTGTGHGLAAMEAEQLVGCGLTPEQAIAALTRTAAALLGYGGRLGTLTAGAIADAVVVAGDPAADIQCLAEVRLVVKDGAVVCS